MTAIPTPATTALEGEADMEPALLRLEEAEAELGPAEVGPDAATDPDPAAEEAAEETASVAGLMDAVAGTA